MRSGVTALFCRVSGFVSGIFFLGRGLSLLVQLV